MPGQERRPPPEGQPQVYYLAARYTSEKLSKAVYDKAQEIIHRTPCELSSYRFLRPHVPVEHQPWHVVVIGERPNETLHQQFVATLKEGMPTDLPPEAIIHLLERRAQETQKGSWVEHHRTPTVSHKAEKQKRKQQKKSRRRNR